MTAPAYIPATVPNASAVPAPQEFALVPIQAVDYWNLGPWTDPAQEMQSYFKTQVELRPGYDPRFEHAVLVMFDEHDRLIGHLRLKRGGRSYVYVDGADWMPFARALKAASVILAHNHPGGDPHPSEDDLLVARSLPWDARSWKLKLRDFVVVGDGRFCSFAASGLLPDIEGAAEPEPEPEFVLNALERRRFSRFVIGNDRELEGMIFDQADREGVNVDDWISDFVRGETRLHLAGFPGRDPKLAFVADAMSEPDCEALGPMLNEEAADRGLSTRDCGYQIGIESLLARLRGRLAAKEAGGRDSKPAMGEVM
jgi:hypothetical protein